MPGMSGHRLERAPEFLANSRCNLAGREGMAISGSDHRLMGYCLELPQRDVAMERNAVLQRVLAGMNLHSAGICCPVGARPSRAFAAPSLKKGKHREHSPKSRQGISADESVGDPAVKRRRGP